MIVFIFVRLELDCGRQILRRAERARGGEIPVARAPGPPGYWLPAHLGGRGPQQQRGLRLPHQRADDHYTHTLPAIVRTL